MSLPCLALPQRRSLRHPVGLPRLQQLAGRDRSRRGGPLHPRRLRHDADHGGRALGGAPLDYFSATKPDELVVFKTFDSATDGRCRFTLHSAFDYPEGTALHRSEVTPRESVEVRVLCIDCQTESAGASAKL